jgi:hypothetical protein
LKNPGTWRKGRGNASIVNRMPLSVVVQHETSLHVMKAGGLALELPALVPAVSAAVELGTRAGCFLHQEIFISTEELRAFS